MKYHQSGAAAGVLLGLVALLFFWGWALALWIGKNEEVQTALDDFFDFDSVSEQTTYDSEVFDYGEYEDEIQRAKEELGIEDPEPVWIGGLPQYNETCAEKNNAASYVSPNLTSQYLAGGFVVANKFSRALDFAGLTQYADRQGYVVLAMGDAVWDSYISPAQSAYLYESPERMRQLVGWHIIAECFGYNEASEIRGGERIEVKTLNGQLAFTNNTPALGNFGGASVTIWDWYTKNGAVTYVDGFVDPTAIPFEAD